jgi:hypothetical protein
MTDIQHIIGVHASYPFSVCLMNPPYGANKQGTSAYLHYQFVDNVFSIADMQVSIFPVRMLYSTSKKYDEYKHRFDKYLIDIEEVQSNVFSDTKMQNIGIFTFVNNKHTNGIHVKYADGTNETIQSLSDKGKGFNPYENRIYEYCRTDKSNFNPFRPLGDDKNKLLSQYCDKYIKRRWPAGGKYFLITNLANGSMNATFISNMSGQICNTNAQLKELMMHRNGACCTIMTFDTQQAAENCRDALKRPLMRFFLYSLQDDQNMTARVYTGIPDIDWADDRTKTDEGILMMCGCDKEKAYEYATYCKDIIDKVDKK